MTLPKRGERGFTLIELLIVVAILGVLAAVVIPNVGRFIGRGETEAGKTELTNIQSAVIAMMTDNQLSALPTPVTDIVLPLGQSDMALFPDTSAIGVGLKEHDPSGTDYAVGDKIGYILYQHDIIADAALNGLVNYVATQNTKGKYTVDAAGTVTQESTGYE
jgi:prepilin-type N-terminal cleavage/methylation domain-containing protein